MLDAHGRVRVVSDAVRPSVPSRESYEHWDDYPMADDAHACLWLTTEGLPSSPMVCCRLAEAVSVGRALLQARAVFSAAYLPCCATGLPVPFECSRDAFDNEESRDPEYDNALRLLKMASKRLGLIWPDGLDEDVDNESWM